MRRLIAGATFLLIVTLSACEAERPEPAAERAVQVERSALSPGADSLGVAAVVDSFHAALAQGDTAAVRILLAQDALVLEAGGLEDREEYFSHHLAADMAFASAIEREREVERVEVAGDVAWVVSTSRSRGTFREREIDSRGAELMVLTRIPDGWRISAVHWSSAGGG